VGRAETRMAQWMSVRFTCRFRVQSPIAPLHSLTKAVSPVYWKPARRHETTQAPVRQQAASNPSPLSRWHRTAHKPTSAVPLDRLCGDSYPLRDPVTPYPVGQTPGRLNVMGGADYGGLLLQVPGQAGDTEPTTSNPKERPTGYIGRLSRVWHEGLSHRQGLVSRYQPLS